MDRLTIEGALAALADAKTIYKVLFEHGTLEVGFYRPADADRQQPHDRDEVYVVALHFSNWWVKEVTRKKFTN
jgi:hypothetical protein